MRFQKKILINYVILLMTAAILFSALYYSASRKRYVSEEYAYLQTLAGQMAQQLELQYSSMEEAAEALLSDGALLTDLKMLSALPKGNSYRLEVEKNINIKLNTYHIVKRYYRMVIYNEAGDIFASDDFDARKVTDTIPVEQWERTAQATGLKGKPVLFPPHRDSWGIYDQRRVYSLLREVLGYRTYVEVQQTEETLNRIFSIYDDNIKVTAMFGDRNFLYGSEAKEVLDSYRDMGLYGATGVFEIRNPATGDMEIVAAAYSGLTGVTVLLTENRNVVFQKMSGFLGMACGALLLSVGLFAFFLYHASKSMARPVNELRKQMEHTSFDNLEEPIHIENSIDEIKALANAYEKVIKRLRESLVKEKSLSYLQLEARYDLLQAQINPHFFHNVLNVISSRGLSLGDETICEMCESLSGMLRYTTSNKTRYVLIRDEIGYLEQYLYLMKLRYCHKLEYSVDIDEAIKDQVVPKIVFQQMVENSIKHGFNSLEKVLQIRITGRVKEEEHRWEVVFEDNGGGISRETVQKIEEDMALIKKNLKEQRQGIEMEIGGMGLINTYARLFLFFGEEAEFSIQGADGKTAVTITAPMSSDDPKGASA